MALIQLNYVSSALFRTVTVNVVLPCDKLDADRKHYLNRGKKFKTLYLLHGLIGNYTDWISGTRVQRLAEKNDLAVVMPSGDNSFYVNSYAIPNNDYGRFIGEELVEVTRAMFPLSDKREDTFVGGLSMGGFGAMRAAMAYPETFSKAVVLSGALHILDENCDNLADEQLVFGDTALARGTEKDPEALFAKLAEEKKRDPEKQIPDVYFSCGTQDSLMGVNKRYRDLLSTGGADVTFREVPGYGHEWDLWDREIEYVIKNWLPLDESVTGITAGSVRGEEK